MIELPDEAVTAAAATLAGTHSCDPFAHRLEARAALEAALPYLCAEDTQTQDARVRIANAVGEMPYKQWPVLAAKVELRLAEQDATIERLRGQVLQATGTALMDEVRLPEEVRDA